MWTSRCSIVLPVLVILYLTNISANECFLFRSVGNDNNPDFVQQITAQLINSPEILDSSWQQIESFPHEVSTQQIFPNSFYWYVTAVTVPVFWRKHGLLLDWGVIDDSDATFVNGKLVGTTGSLTDKNKSAWNVDRLYWAASTTFTDNDQQIIAVQVKDWGGFGALGGLFGPPVIGVSILKPGQQIERFCGDLSPQTANSTDKDAVKWESYKPGLGSQAETMKFMTIPPQRHNDRRIIPGGLYAYPPNGVFRWYRLTFAPPPEIIENDLIVDFGRINDVAACYINGVLVGQIGVFPNSKDSLGTTLPQTGARFRCAIAKDLIKDKDNILTVRLWTDGKSAGGMFGLPMLPLNLQNIANTYINVEQITQVNEEKQARELLELAETWIHSFLPLISPEGQLNVATTQDSVPKLKMIRRTKDVITVCETIYDKITTFSPDIIQQAIGLKSYALWLANQPEAAWETFKQLDFRRPIPASAAFAAARCQPATGGIDLGVVYTGRDELPQGNWPLYYGQDLAILCAVYSPFDMIYGDRSTLNYELKIGSPVDEKPRAWLGTPQTEDRRALFFPKSGKRRYASWDDRGEAYPFDDNGPDLLLTLKIPVGGLRISFYFMDWDWANGAHPRRQSLLLLDETYKPLSVIDTGKFHDGQYETFLIKDPCTIHVRLSKHRSPCVVLSGLFADCLRPLPHWSRQTNTLLNPNIATETDENQYDTILNTYLQYKEASHHNPFIVATDPAFKQWIEDLAQKAQDKSNDTEMLAVAHALWLAGKWEDSAEFIKMTLSARIDDKIEFASEDQAISRIQLEQFIRKGEQNDYPYVWIAKAIQLLQTKWPHSPYIEELLCRQGSKWTVKLLNQQ